jgi:hypothetical protein
MPDRLLTQWENPGKIWSDHRLPAGSSGKPESGGGVAKLPNWGMRGHAELCEKPAYLASLAFAPTDPIQ